MADTTFVDKVTHVVAAWLNDVNKAVYRAIGTGTGGMAPTTPGDVRTNLGLAATAVPSGASLIGNNTSGGSAGANVQAALDLKANSSSLFTDPRHRFNAWDDAATPGNAAQTLEYTVTSNTSTGDRLGWSAVVNENSASNPDNFVALVGHALHLGAWNGGAYWGIATEAWSNASGGATLIGGELSVISQYPGGFAPNIGMNAVFKNRPDVATHPTAPVIDGSLYNYNSNALFITSQPRPSGAGAAWGSVGSGWQTALKVGDIGTGSGLDWEGGSYFPGSSVYKAYTTIVDMTNALTDMAGGNPWFALYRNSATYWGMRFNGMLTGQLDTENLKVNAGGAGYAAGDHGNIVGGGGSGATYWVKAVAGGVVTQVAIVLGGVGYAVNAALATTTSGAGAGLTLDITIAVGRVYGANLDITAGGAGYFVGELVSLDTGTAGYAKPTLQVLTVAAGVVTSFKLLSNEVTPVGAPRLNPNGRGFTVAVGKATTSLTGAGAGFTVVITKIYDDTLIGGERWEFWRMLNPGAPISTGARHGWIDASFPGSPLTIDTSGATYTFPVDRPL